MKKLIQIASALYVVGVAGWFLLNVAFVDGLWWLTILNQVAALLFVPLPFLLLGELVARRWKYAAALLIPLCILLWTQWPHLVPIALSAPVERDFRVMTYNILKTNEDYEGIISVIRSVEPDLVALQEVDEGQMIALEEAFSELYPHSAVAQLPEWEWNTAVVFSRYPFIEVETLDLEEIRPAMRVQVEVDGERLTFISAHLYYYNWWKHPLPTIPSLMRERTARQNRQTEILIEQMENESTDVILACDCNSKLTQSSYKMFLQRFKSAQLEIARQFRQSAIEGARFDRDMFNVDHILYEGNLNPVGAYSVDDAGGSDHRAMISDFVFLD